MGGSKITADGDCSHEIKRRLLLGRKVMTNLGSILKNRDITLPTKVCLVQAMFFSVVMYGCESWTIKKAENQRINAFELWCWRRLLSPLDCEEIQPVHPKGNQSDYSLEGCCLAFFMVQLSHLYMITGKTIALTIWPLACFNNKHNYIMTSLHLP